MLRCCTSWSTLTTFGEWYCTPWHYMYEQLIKLVLLAQDSIRRPSFRRIKNLSGKYWILHELHKRHYPGVWGRWGRIYVTSDLLSLVGQTPFHKDAAVCPLQCHSIVHQCIFCTMSDPLASFPGCLVWERGYQPTGNWTKWLLLLVRVSMCDQSFEKGELEQRMTTTALA